jgi:arylsulfatase A-like enzyme
MSHQPNILLVTTDQQRFDACGPFAPRWLRLPHTDHLRSEGVTFTSDYYRWMARSGQPRQPMHHGLGQNELHPAMATVPEALTLTSWIAEQCVESCRRWCGRPVASRRATWMAWT